MGLMLDALKQIEVPTPPAPVILPLPLDENRGSRGERRGTSGEENEQPNAQHNGYFVQHSACIGEQPAASPVSRPSSLAPSSVQRFAFPKLSEPREPSPPAELRKVVWPEHEDTETAWACAETAAAILRQLSLQRSTAVAFTSPGDGDGKTSLLLALAPQLAKRTSGGVLVVDANPKNPGLTRRLNLPVDETAARSALIYPTNLPRLNVLPATSISQPRSLDLSWLEELREGWPLVLLDMPSLVHPEVASLARCCEGVYLVVRLGHTSRRAISEAARVIRGSGGRLLGCVIIG